MNFRAFLAILAAVFYFICSLPLMLIVWAAGKISPSLSDRLSYPIICWGFRMVNRMTGCPITVIGKENIPKDQAVLFAANHRSIFDVIMGATVLPRPFTIIAKKEMEHIPLLSFWMRRIHILFLDRKDIRAGVQMVADAADYLKKGYHVLIFPEGTRGKIEGTLQEFKGGSFKIAIRAGAPVVPMTIIGTGDMLEDHMLKVKKRPITIVFGKPIATKGMPIPERKNLHIRVQHEIADTYQHYAPESWKGIIGEDYMPEHSMEGKC